MSAESDLYAALSGDSSVTAIVSDRIFSDVRDQETDIPAIYFERSGTETITSIHNSQAIAEFASMTVVCFDESREAAETLANNVITAATTAGLIYTGREGQYDSESDTFVSILSFTHNKGN